MNPNTPTMNTLSLIATALGLAFLAALWLSLIFWTWRDIRRRSRDRVLRTLSLLVVILLFIPGVIIYLVLRPNKTLDEEYQRSLEEEALLRSIEDMPVCPGCNRATQPAWVVCPSCHTKLKKNCYKCQAPLELAWNICPICGEANETVVQEPGI